MKGEGNEMGEKRLKKGKGMGKDWEGKGTNGEVKSKETDKGGTFKEREKQ